MLKRIETRIDPTCGSEWHQFLYGDYEPYVEVIEETVLLPIARRVFAQTLALDLVSVRPMDLPADGWLDRRALLMAMEYHIVKPNIWKRIYLAIKKLFTFTKWN